MNTVGREWGEGLFPNSIPTLPSSKVVSYPAHQNGKTKAEEVVEDVE